MRIEDLDPPRVVRGSADEILQTLDACGMHWDGRVVYQSTRSEAYHCALHELRRSAKVYACACSRREIADSAVAGIESYVYPGTCRAGLPAGRAARAWRIDTHGAAITFDDAIQGTVTQDVFRDVGDFVLYRADGVYAYQLAVAMDDAEQGITHIVRGADLLESTPRQVLLQRLLGFPTPRYAHLPVAVNHEGEKLSKQTRAQPVDVARASSALVEALRFLGHEPQRGLERASIHEVWSWAREHWRLDRVPRVRSRKYESLR